MVKTVSDEVLTNITYGPYVHPDIFDGVQVQPFNFQGCDLPATKVNISY